jgi:hypothetical protein
MKNMHTHHHRHALKPADAIYLYRASHGQMPINHKADPAQDDGANWMPGFGWRDAIFTLLTLGR